MPGCRPGSPASFSRGFDPGSPVKLCANHRGGLIEDFRQFSRGNQLVIDLLNALQWVVKIILVGLIVPLVSASITGYDRRTYAVLLPEEVVQIAGIRRSVKQLAAKYQPAMFLRSTTPSPPLLWVWYEAVPNQAILDFVYYYAWRNEIHPEPFIHALYSIYRAAYYGYPLNDIEYFQVSVSPATGEVVGLRFETSSGDDYFASVNQHLVAQYQRNANGTFTEEISSTDGNPISMKDEASVLFTSDHVLAGVQTWNHLSRLLAPFDQDFDIALQAALKPLNNQDYARFKFVRKSQGDHQSQEIRWKFPAAVIATLALIGYPVLRIGPGNKSMARALSENNING
jgi:hypothetical protein